MRGRRFVGVVGRGRSAVGPGYFFGFANDRTNGAKTYTLTSRELVEMSAVRDEGSGGDWDIWSDVLGESIYPVPGLAPYLPSATAYEYVTLPPGNYTGATGRVEFSGSGAPHVGTWEAGLDIYDSTFTVVETDTQTIDPIPAYSSAGYTLDFAIGPFTVGPAGGYMALHVDGTGPANEVNDASFMQVDFDSL